LKEDDELLIELERRCEGRLMLRADLTFHHGKFLVTDANPAAELKPQRANSSPRNLLSAKQLKQQR
jgi:hypothetical protein